jgi:hypothetical protein
MGTYSSDEKYSTGYDFSKEDYYLEYWRVGESQEL